MDESHKAARELMHKLLDVLMEHVALPYVDTDSVRAGELYIGEGGIPRRAYYGGKVKTFKASETPKAYDVVSSFNSRHGKRSKPKAKRRLGYLTAAERLEKLSQSAAKGWETRRKKNGKG